jgi:hypothetical protein
VMIWSTPPRSLRSAFTRRIDALRARQFQLPNGGSECLQQEAQKLEIPRITIGQRASRVRLLPNCFGLRRPVRLKTDNKTDNKTSNRGGSHA